MKNWQKKKVLVIGAARQGLALARFLSARGAVVTVNDKKPAEMLAEAIHRMESYPIDWQLGHHDLHTLDGKDLVCVSGGVPLTMELVREAARRGVPITNDTQIFMQEVPCEVVGITGSAGKTTTTTLAGRMADAAYNGTRKVWVGGNIGLPLIDVVDSISSEDLVILEISSFQLELTSISPKVSAVLNLTPNHLDRHLTMEAYTRTKSRIFRFQDVKDWTILGYDDPGTRALIEEVPGRLITFGLQPHRNNGKAVYTKDGNICFNEGREEKVIMPAAAVALRGNHNLLNVLAACAVSIACSIPFRAMQDGVSGFTGVPHRLEYVRTLRGAGWYNDSKATTPEGSLAAVNAFDEPLILLLGGRDKLLPWENLAKRIRERVDHLIVFGEAADKILSAVGPVKPGSRPFTIDQFAKLRDAVERASRICQEKDIVLLAPGCTSFDEFNNFEERGEKFKQWVNKLS